MFYAIKGNKQLKIDETEKSAFLKLGYDIAEADGDTLNVIETSSTKTVSYAQYKALLDENNELKDQLSGIEEAMAKENKSLKEKLADANKKLKELGQG